MHKISRFAVNTLVHVGLVLMAIINVAGYFQMQLAERGNYVGGSIFVWIVISFSYWGWVARQNRLLEQENERFKELMKVDTGIYADEFEGQRWDSKMIERINRK